MSVKYSNIYKIFEYLSIIRTSNYLNCSSSMRIPLTDTFIINGLRYRSSTVLPDSKSCNTARENLDNIVVRWNSFLFFLLTN